MTPEWSKRLHSAKALFLAAAAASIAPAFIVYGVASVDDAIEAARGHATLEEAWLLAYATIFLGCILWTAITAGPCFLLCLWVARRMKAYRWQYYSLAGFVSVYALTGPLALTPMIVSMPENMTLRAVIIASMMTAFTGFVSGPLGGFAYWLYASRHPPISDWRRDQGGSSKRDERLPQS